MTDTKELIDLLREVKVRSHDGYWSRQWNDPLMERIDATIAKYEAEPERKCGTCSFYSDRGRCSNFKGPLYPAPDWSCADWQRGEQDRGSTTPLSHVPEIFK